MADHLTLPAELTSAQAMACLAELSAGVRQESKSGIVVIDAGPLERFDSSAIAVLLEVRRACAAAGRPFAVQSMPARLHELAKLYGVAALLPAVA